MSIEEIIKLDRKWGEHYILVPTPYDGWRLFRTGSNREIMNSDNNTKEQLLEFVREHKKYNITKAISTTCLVINVLWLLVIFANFFIKSKTITCMSWGVLLTLLPVLIVLDVVMSNNKKVINKVADEDVEYLNKLESKRVVDNIIKHQKMETKTKSKTKSSTKPRTRKPRNKVEEKKDVWNI